MSQKVLLVKQLSAALEIIHELNALILQIIPAVDPLKIGLDGVNEVIAKVEKCRKIVADIQAELARI